MVGIQQYPYKLKATISSSDSTVDDNGNIIPSPTIELEYNCRYRPNTSAKSVQTIEGQTIIYKGTAYINGQDVDVKTGDEIEVVGFISGIVLQVHKAQFRTRVIL